MEEKQYSVIGENISKCYKMYSGPKEKLLDLISPKGAGKTFYALKDISFKIEKGQVVGILGLNGSGKSTLSNILGGVSIPSKGEITLNGESSVIAIGLGLNNFLTGIENIEVKALMMGYKKDEIEKITQEVIEFADIGDFVNQPIRTYSSGMRSRLGFAISIHTNPDILVIDEALSVGDPTFTQKCLDKMNEFRDSGKTIFFVSHSLGQVKQFCNKAMWLEYGKLKEYGDIGEVLPKYESHINMINKMSEKERKAYKIETLKDQEHSLLREFKLIDPKLKKVKPKGKVFKSVELIDKNNTMKMVPYNFDILTLAFGFVPSLSRKRYEAAIVILIAQILNLFIIPFPISVATNFLITFISALVTGKNYTNYLIEKKSYIPFHIWENNMEDEFNDFEKKYQIDSKKEIFKKKTREKKISIILSVIFIIIVTSATIAYKYRNEIASLTTSNKEMINIKNMMIVMINDSNENEKYIDNITILNTESSTGKIKGDIYPGQLQVKSGEGYNELREVTKSDDIEELKKVIKANFGIDTESYILMTTKELDNYESDKVKEFYTKSTSELLKSEDEDFEKKVEEILLTSKSLNKDVIEKFQKEYKNNTEKIIFNLIKYQEVKLTDIITEDILKDIGMENLINHKLYITDNRMLQNNTLVKKINEKHKDYEEKKVSEDIKEETPSMESQEDYYVPPADSEPESPVVPPVVAPEKPKPPAVAPEKPKPPAVKPEKPTPPVEEPEKPTPPVEEPEKPAPPTDETEKPIPPVEEPEKPTPPSSDEIEDITR